MSGDDALFDTDPFNDSLLNYLDGRALSTAAKVTPTRTSSANASTAIAATSTSASLPDPDARDSVSPVLRRKVRRRHLGTALCRTVGSTQSTQSDPCKSGGCHSEGAREQSENSGAKRRRSDRLAGEPPPLNYVQRSPPMDFDSTPCESTPIADPTGRRVDERSGVRVGAGDTPGPSQPDLLTALPLSGLCTPGRPSSVSQLQRRALLERLRSADSPVGSGSAPLPGSQPVPGAVGPFYGLPACVASLLDKQRGIKSLYDWQKQCLALKAVRQRRNLVYSLPTSGGKTLVAELLLLRELVCRQQDCLLVLPYVAIVQEKVRSLAPFGVALGFIVSEYAGERGQYPPPVRKKRRTVYVCTIEKAVGVVTSLQQEGRVSELGLAVIDELHMLGDGTRGASLELLIIFLKNIKADVQLIGMSATIGNMAEVCHFFSAESFSRSFRPVQLRECVLLNNQLLEVTGSSADQPDELLTPLRHIKFTEYSEKMRAADPDGVGGLVAEIVPLHSCLVFCATKRNCQAVSLLICRALNKSLMEHERDKKLSLYRALQEESGGDVCKVLRQTLPYGIAYHHSGLTGDERRLLEEAYIDGTLCCLCCTSTLAAGVNLPAKRVIIRSPYTGASFLSRARYKQMAGRAGRAGIDDSGESILIIKPSDAKQVGQLLTCPVECCSSQLLESGCHGLRRLVVSAVALQLATTIHQLRKLLESSLLALQNSKDGDDRSSAIDLALNNVVNDLHRDKLLRVIPLTDQAHQREQCEEALPSDQVAVDCSEDGSESGSRDYRLKVSRLALAATKGSVDLGCATQLYSDLHSALTCMSLRNHLHLLFLVTPYDVMQQLPPPLPDVYLDVYSCLNEEEVDVARRLGVTESMLVKLMSGKTPTPVCHRFYFTLILHWLLQSNTAAQPSSQSSSTSTKLNSAATSGGTTLSRVASRFQLLRGQLQQLVSSTAAFAAGVLRFCQQLDELWPLAQLFEVFNKQLAVGCTVELLELMQLPAVKHGRARALYTAGFTNLQLLANAEPEQLVQKLHHLTRRVAVQIVDSAKMLVLEKAEALQEEAEFMLDGLRTIQFHESPGLGELILTGIDSQ